MSSGMLASTIVPFSNVDDGNPLAANHPSYMAVFVAILFAKLTIMLWLNPSIADVVCGCFMRSGPKFKRWKVCIILG